MRRLRNMVFLRRVRGAVVTFWQVHRAGSWLGCFMVVVVVVYWSWAVS